MRCTATGKHTDLPLSLPATHSHTHSRNIFSSFWRTERYEKRLQWWTDNRRQGGKARSYTDSLTMPKVKTVWQETWLKVGSQVNKCSSHQRTSSFSHLPCLSLLSLNSTVLLYIQPTDLTACHLTVCSSSLTYSQLCFILLLFPAVLHVTLTLSIYSALIITICGLINLSFASITKQLFLI